MLWLIEINKIMISKTVSKNKEFLDKFESITDPYESLSKISSINYEKLVQHQPLSPSDVSSLIIPSSEKLPYVCKVASMYRDSGKGKKITFSPKIFIPLTQLCKDKCGYCTFRKEPDNQEPYLSIDYVVNLAKKASELGCLEALFTLGERPESVYPQAKKWLKKKGFKSTLDYLFHACSNVLDNSSLFPHSNPGNMTKQEMIKLKEVNLSLGLMLESTSERLTQLNNPHFFAPSKWPKVRKKMLNISGNLGIPFTTGILIGIGETFNERIDSLFAIKEIDSKFNHINEIIIQNFVPKINTLMKNYPKPTFEELLWTTALARLILGPKKNIQVPPNLTNKNFPLILLSGINDWGGVSPITIDFVNPESPWPTIKTLKKSTEFFGFELTPRLATHPDILKENKMNLSKRIQKKLKDSMNSDGFPKINKGYYENYHS